MIKIGKTILKQQPNFWNHCIFHPTDAIEDPWGRRILDKISDDGAIGMVRIYSMFEDIVYISENGKLKKSWIPAGTPIIGGTVMCLSQEDGKIAKAYHYYCKNVEYEK